MAWTVKQRGTTMVRQMQLCSLTSLVGGGAIAQRVQRHATPVSGIRASPMLPTIAARGVQLLACQRWQASQHFHLSRVVRQAR
jgi:hypothetical protein